MQSRIALISIFTDKLEDMVRFYRDALGFQVAFQMGEYIEFKSENVRFAVCSLKMMRETIDHPGFKAPRSGLAFQLAFDAVSPAEVDRAYADLLGKGAAAVKAPADIPWNERTAFFADPDGNVHEIYAAIPQA